MDNMQFKEAKERVAELQAMDDIDPVEEMELDRLIREMNEFKEK